MRRKLGELISEGAIVEVQDGNHGGQHPKASDYVVDGVGVPFIMASDLALGWVDLQGCKRIPRPLADGLRIGFSRPGDVLLTHKGTVGSVAIVPAVDDYVMLTPQVTYYRTEPTKLHNHYLKYAFLAPGFQDRLASFSAQSTRPYIALSTQRQLEIDYHPLKTQVRIAEVLSTYDDLIENNTRRIQILEDIVRLIHSEWIVHFRFPGHQRARFVGAGKARRPSDWALAPLGNIVEEVRRICEPSDLAPETAYIGLEHMPRRSFTLREWGRLDEVTSTKLAYEAGEILFGKIRPYFHKVIVAPTDGVTSSDAIVIVPRDDKWRVLALTTVSSDPFVAHATQTSNGTKMPRANWNLLVEYQVPLPAPRVLGEFNAEILPLIELANNLAAQSRSLRAGRDLLLPRLVSGELSVSELESIAA